MYSWHLLIIIIMAAAITVPILAEEESNVVYAYLKLTSGHVTGFIKFTQKVCGGDVWVYWNFRGQKKAEYYMNFKERGDTTNGCLNMGRNLDPNTMAVDENYGFGDNDREIGILNHHFIPRNSPDWYHNFTKTTFTLRGPRSIIGRGVILHEVIENGHKRCSAACGVVGLM